MTAPFNLEHTLSSGETIVMIFPGSHPTKPYQVLCIATNDEIRWSKDFATLTEAEKEYHRFG